jgi:tetratricopeptide (TPR) repeat protein
MTPERWQQVRAVFDEAVEQPNSDPEDFARRACGDDEDLLKEVLEMLRRHGETAFVDHPPIGPGTAPARSGAPPVFQEAQIVAGRYRILRYLGRGGMGEVYEARDLEGVAETVALKTLLPEIAGDESMIARFKQEIALSRKVAHPNVCRVFDLSRHDAADGRSIIFLTMEFLAGETLADRLRGGPMSEAEALPLLEQMAAALDASHEAGVIHRDFKPSNVMLVPAGDGYRVVVTDFGLARRFATSGSPTVTMTNAVAGTLDYMAPDLLTGSPASFASDVYALGMTAYKMMTGVLPFTADTPLAAAVMRINRAVPSPRVLKPSLDEKWERAILRALDPKSGNRFSSARHFVQALRGERGSVTVKLPEITRRRAVVAAVAVLMVVAGPVGWRAWVSRSQRLPVEAQALYQKGVDDIGAGAYFAATKALQEAARVAPRAAQVHARLAEAWLGLDQAERAAEEMLLVKRQDLSALPKADRLQIEAIDFAITRDFSAVVAKYEELARNLGDSPEVEVELGHAYEDASRPSDAIRSYGRAAEGPQHNPAAWLRLGVLYGRQSNKTKSDEAFAQAERHYHLTSNLEGLTQVALEEGIAANRRGDLAAGVAYLQKALGTARTAGNLQQEITAKLRLSTNAYQSGDAATAERYANEALDTARSHELDAMAIRGLINLGAAFVLKQDFARAEQYYRQALDLARQTHSGHLKALSLLSLAGLHDQAKDHKEAVEEAKEALSFYQANRYEKEYQQCLTVIIRAQRDGGDYDGALASSRSLLQSSEKTGDRAQISSAHENIGSILSKQDNYPGALEEFGRSLDRATDEAQIGYAAFHCGDASWRLGNYADAVKMFAKADGSAEKFRPLRLELLCSRAEMSLSRGRFKEAIDLARGALSDEFSRTPDKNLEIQAVLGLALIGAGNKREGLKKCEESWSATTGISGTAEKIDLGVTVLEARIESGQWESALQVFHEIEPRLAAFPELRWRALALASRADPHYSSPAREARMQISRQWGESLYNTYLKRRDVEKLSWPLF